MRSKAQIMGHPIHPILIAFPIAFGVGAPAFNLAGILGEWRTVWSAGAYMSVAAVVTGLIAGVPGFIDYVSVVPPNSSAKKRATWHMGVNVVALGLIGLGWLFRDLDTLRPGIGTIVLEAAGMGVMGIGGWLGGTLVYRNQIGVDHRYAEAGKWTEQTVDGQPGTAVDVAGAEELAVDQMKLLHVNGRRVVLVRTPDGHAACDDHCTHQGGSLAGGVAACGVLVCPWHGSQFDAKTGEVKAGPASESIRTYKLELVDGRIRLVLPGNPG